jgi:hypothetical protein
MKDEPDRLEDRREPQVCTQKGSDLMSSSCSVVKLVWKLHGARELQNPRKDLLGPKAFLPQ